MPEDALSAGIFGHFSCGELIGSVRRSAVPELRRINPG
jgi:hypothetical protein